MAASLHALPHRAADLVQDTFCRLLEKAHLKTVHEPRGYLATVARRLLIDDIRRREIERVYISLQADGAGTSDHLTPERMLDAVQLLDDVMGLLDTLSVKARSAFVMIRIDGVSYAAAAEQLGVSERMVKRYVAQGYARCYAVAYPA